MRTLFLHPPSHYIPLPPFIGREEDQGPSSRTCRNSWPHTSPSCTNIWALLGVREPPLLPSRIFTDKWEWCMVLWPPISQYFLSHS